MHRSAGELILMKSLLSIITVPDFLFIALCLSHSLLLDSFGILINQTRHQSCLHVFCQSDLISILQETFIQFLSSSFCDASSDISYFSVVSVTLGNVKLSQHLSVFSCVLVSLQIEAAKGFLSVLRSYLDSLCCNIRSHTITNVQSNDDKVCVLVSSTNQVRHFDIYLNCLNLSEK